MYFFGCNTNQSGTIEGRDFELAVEKTCRMRGWDEKHAKYRETYDNLMHIWEILRTKADTDNDDKVTTDEWYEMWSKDSNEEEDWQTKYMDFMFQLEDTSGDGIIDENEFISVYTHYGIPADECRQAFGVFSQNNTVKVTKDYFRKLWKEYFMSDDPKSTGNFIFGKIKFD
uniref:EF-hand domain-containing protein n=1 Tax=Strigamia maritima TaxID=126957 RepID=T1IX98_STRMM